MIGNKAYAGIGSRQTPDDVCNAMTVFATRLRATGYWLRSGGAPKADRAFETGADGHCTIYRPKHVTQAALDLAEHYHPNWAACDQYARSLHARNGFIVLGAELNQPVDFIVCWTASGGLTGGTAQALRIAADPQWAIPVYNLFNSEDTRAFVDLLVRLEAHA